VGLKQALHLCVQPPQLLVALLRLPPFLKNRKSAYRFVNDLGLRFRELLEAVGGDPSSEAARRALAAHDEALRDLQKLAGVR